MSISERMKAAVLCGVEQLEIRDVARPEVGPHDVLVKVQAVGLCGTDFHLYAGHANYHTNAHGEPIPLEESPQILGHEVTGLVADLGREVKDLRIGERVVIDQGLNCSSRHRRDYCEYCATGNSHQCEFYGEHGITGLPGGLAEYMLVPAVNAVPLQNELQPFEAALTEPLGCIIHSSEMAERARTRYQINSDEHERRVRSVLICGGGPAGLLFLQYIRNCLRFDGLIVVSEPNARKRELATRFGAETIDPHGEDLVDRVAELTEARRVEYLIEATGIGRVTAQIPSLIRKQATVLLYGHGNTGVELSALNHILFKEPTLVASVGASGGFDAAGRPLIYQRALNLLESRQVSVAPFVTHQYRSLHEVPDVFQEAYRAPDYIKGVVTL